jgi:hypothetical protein
VSPVRARRGGDQLLAGAEGTEPTLGRPGSVRPASYWGLLAEVEEIILRIPGTERRSIAKRILDTAGFEGLRGWLAKEELSEAERTAWGRIHPALMGGEFLPPIEAAEVEIARIAIASTTGDVISVRATHEADGIRYSIVDEYETEFTPTIERSKQPLSLRELIELIDGSSRGEDDAGVVLPILAMNYEYSDDPETLTSFISVSSAYYPGLGAFYDERIDEWLGAQEAARNGIDLKAVLGQFAAPERALLEADHGNLRGIGFARRLIELVDHEVALARLAERFGRPEEAGYLARVLEAAQKELEGG